MTTPTGTVPPGAAPAAPVRPGTPPATEAQGEQFAGLVERHLADERPNRAASDTTRDRRDDRPARTTSADRARRTDRPSSRPQALRGHDDTTRDARSTPPVDDPQVHAAGAQPAPGQQAGPAGAGAAVTAGQVAVPTDTAPRGEAAAPGSASVPSATAGAAQTLDGQTSAATQAPTTGAATPAAAAQLDAVARQAGVPVTVVAASSTPAGTAAAAPTGSAQPAPTNARHDAGTTDAAAEAPSGTGAAAGGTTAVAGGAQAHPGSQDGAGHDADRAPVPAPDAPGAPGVPGSGNPAVTGSTVAATTVPTQAASGSPVLDQVLPAVPALMAKGQGVHSLTLRLHPADLGEVHLTVTVRGDKVDVTIAAGDRARDVLREGSLQLRSLLDLAGHSSGSFTVRDLPGSGALTTGSAGHGAGQDSQQEAGSSQPQGFVAGQGSQPGQDGGAQAREGRPGGDVPATPAASARPDGHGRTTTQPVRPRAAGTSALDVTI